MYSKQQEFYLNSMNEMNNKKTAAAAATTTTTSVRKQ